MAFSQSDIAALKAAMASGAMRVRYSDGREVQYRTLAEMREILRTMKDEVSPAGSSDAPLRTIVAGF